MSNDAPDVWESPRASTNFALTMAACRLAIGHLQQYGYHWPDADKMWRKLHKFVKKSER